jgi:HAD superfamily hydrolase (TIGR01549 family)
MTKKLVVLLDCGDTLIDESTQVLDDRGIVQSAGWIDGAPELLDFLKAEQYRVCLVADGETESFDNIFRVLGKRDVFEGWVTSQEVGVQKPDGAMFEAAFRAMRLSSRDKRRAVMIGNNLKKDVVGANSFGISSIWMRWSPRYVQAVSQLDWQPTYTAEHPRAVIALLEKMEAGL